MFNRLKHSTVAIMLCIASTANADRVITVEPGLWEYTHSLNIPGLLSPTTTPKTECITPEQSQRNLSDLFGDLTKDDKCTITKLKDTLNTVEFDLTCTPKLGEFTLTSNGHAKFRYSRTKISGSASGEISFNGATPIDVSGIGYAKRIGRCKN